MYPILDNHLEEPLKYKREWSNVMRCVAVFVGINHASAVSLTFNGIHYWNHSFRNITRFFL